jgi:hypothetical protein
MLDPLLEVPPVRLPPVTVGVVHVYVVPEGTIPFAPVIGTTEKNCPLQTAVVMGEGVILGLGFTVMVTFLVFAQPSAVKV